MSDDWVGGNNLLSLLSHPSISETDKKSKRFLNEQAHGFGMPLRSSINSLISFRMARQSLQDFPVVSEKPKKIKNDKRFELWNKYLEERRQLNERLSKKLNRPIQSLIMNTIEAYRLKHEDQLIFDYITILDPPHPQRGSPAFWTLPIRLIPKCGNDVIPLEVRMDAREKCQIPEIEYVAVPNHIRQETNTLERTKYVKHV